MKYEIDIDLGRLADEWEPTGEFRVPKKDDHYYIRGGRVETAYDDFKTDSHLIIRGKWKWPEWLTAEWIAMDERGVWFAYLNEPSHGVNSWCGGQCVGLSLGLLKFDAPTCTDWRQSKRRNPRAT